MYQVQPAPASSPSSTYEGQGTPQTAQELQALVAPIALYPDSLVAQILSAATYPDQVAVANNWLQQNKNLTGTALGQAVDKQSWDPSVKALTQFPSVLNNLAQNLAWTSQLGEAYHNQQADVMTAIQTLRAQAKAAGNLKSGSQITVVQQSPQTIVIQPTNPQIVYVPEYNPTVVYGTPYVVPGYSTGDLVAASALSFGRNRRGRTDERRLLRLGDTAVGTATGITAGCTTTVAPTTVTRHGMVDTTIMATTPTITATTAAAITLTTTTTRATTAVATTPTITTAIPT